MKTKQHTKLVDLIILYGIEKMAIEETASLVIQENNIKGWIETKKQRKCIKDKFEKNINELFNDIKN